MALAEEALHDFNDYYDPRKRAFTYDEQLAAYEAVVEPLYQACAGPDDLMAGFRAYYPVAGVTDPKFVDATWLKTFCSPAHGDSRSCEGYKAALARY